MATPSPQPLAHIKTAARKLPVKRRSPHPSSSSSSSVADPNPNPNPGPSSLPLPALPPSNPNGDDVEEDDDDPDADDPEQPDDDDDDDDAARGRSGGTMPFKFQRIWSEPDEIRFLQGLLACHPQGMTFPRDLNLYFDRFSESMSQPYTRSQLSEKLRRLRKKFRSHAARVARGLDPSALPPHDRDLFHLSTLLWDPAFGASSPFGASSNGTVPGNKRRRHVPVSGGAGAGAGAAIGSSGVGGRVKTSALPSPPRALPSPPPRPASPPPLTHLDTKCGGGTGGCNGPHEEQPPLQQKGLFFGGRDDGLGPLAAKAALDVFDSCLNEVRATLVRRGMLDNDESPILGTHGDLSKRWRAQRVAELDVLARRLRLSLCQVVKD